VGWAVSGARERPSRCSQSMAAAAWETTQPRASNRIARSTPASTRTDSTTSSPHAGCRCPTRADSPATTPPVRAGLEVVEQTVFAHDAVQGDGALIIGLRATRSNTSLLLMLRNPDAQSSVWTTRHKSRMPPFRLPRGEVRQIVQPIIPPVFLPKQLLQNTIPLRSVPRG
jgi:hypothetical protein